MPNCIFFAPIAIIEMCDIGESSYERGGGDVCGLSTQDEPYHHSTMIAFCTTFIAAALFGFHFHRWYTQYLHRLERQKFYRDTVNFIWGSMNLGQGVFALVNNMRIEYVLSEILNIAQTANDAIQQSRIRTKNNESNAREKSTPKCGGSSSSSSDQAPNIDFEHLLATLVQNPNVLQFADQITSELNRQMNSDNHTDN